MRVSPECDPCGSHQSVCGPCGSHQSVVHAGLTRVCVVHAGLTRVNESSPLPGCVKSRHTLFEVSISLGSTTVRVGVT